MYAQILCRSNGCNLGYMGVISCYSCNEIGPSLVKVFRFTAAPRNWPNLMGVNGTPSPLAGAADMWESRVGLALSCDPLQAEPYEHGLPTQDCKEGEGSPCALLGAPPTSVRADRGSKAHPPRCDGAPLPRAHRNGSRRCRSEDPQRGSSGSSNPSK